MAERISSYPVTEETKEQILAEVEAIYRRERAATLPERAATPSGQGGK